VSVASDWLGRVMEILDCVVSSVGIPSEIFVLYPDGCRIALVRTDCMLEAAIIVAPRTNQIRASKTFNQRCERNSRDEIYDAHDPSHIPG
jgi:hypothetical protein